MKFLERDLEDIISGVSVEELYRIGLKVPLGYRRKRQVRIGNYGVADIVSMRRNHKIPDDGILNELSGNPTITVVELKLESISLSAFLQAVRYVKGIKRYFEKKRSYLQFANFHICLIGRRINTESDLVYLPEIIDTEKIHVSIYTYSYEVDGLTFKAHNHYRLNKEGF